MAFAVRGLGKTYGGIEVLKDVDLVVEDGEIHALLGANGAGKSTLIKCLSGAVAPDSGEMIVGDRRYAALTPRDARQAGIAVIYQDLSLAMSLNVADNMFLGQELRHGPFVRRRAQHAEARHWLRELEVEVAPGDTLSALPAATLQAVEIAKALRGRPKVLILDEPTAALSEREAEALGQHLLVLKRQRLPLLYVTHRLNEVTALADRVTVLRGGRTVLTGKVAEISRERIMEAIVGQRVQTTRAVSVPSGVPARPMLSVRHLLAPGIGPIDFDVCGGEILGVFGLVGSGRTELLETLFGARTRYGGTMTLDGRALSHLSPATAVAEGIALVPSDRLRKSIIGALRAEDSMLLPAFRLLAWAGLMRRRSAERGVFQRAASQLNLQPPRPDLEARRFSGGNQQKIVVARWLNETRGCRLLMLDEPTQGVDIGARRDIYESLRATAAAGRAVLLTSSEPEELVQIAHRVVVLSGGRVAGMLAADEVEEGRLLALAHRVEQQQEAAA